MDVGGLERDPPPQSVSAPCWQSALPRATHSPHCRSGSPQTLAASGLKLLPPLLPPQALYLSVSVLGPTCPGTLRARMPTPSVRSPFSWLAFLLFPLCLLTAWRIWGTQDPAPAWVNRGPLCPTSSPATMPTAFDLGITLVPRFFRSSQAVRIHTGEHSKPL